MVSLIIGGFLSLECEYLGILFLIFGFGIIFKIIEKFYLKYNFFL